MSIAGFPNAFIRVREFLYSPSFFFKSIMNVFSHLSNMLNMSACIEVFMGFGYYSLNMVNDMTDFKMLN